MPKDAEYMRDFVSYHIKLPLKSISGWKLYSKIRDFNIMPENSILANFGKDFIIEIVNVDVLKNLQYFILYKT